MSIFFIDSCISKITAVVLASSASSPFRTGNGLGFLQAIKPVKIALGIKGDQILTEGSTALVVTWSAFGISAFYLFASAVTVYARHTES